PFPRATSNDVTKVEPNEKLEVSSSVACWLSGLVSVSVLSLTRVNVGAGVGGGGCDLPPPQATISPSIPSNNRAATRKRRLTTFGFSRTSTTRKKSLILGVRTRSPILRTRIVGFDMSKLTCSQ